MSANISTKDAYVLETTDTHGTHNPDYDTIVQGMSVKEDPSRPEGAWGTAAWFDKVSGVMRMVLIESAPLVENGKFKVRSTDGDQLCFTYISRPVYNTIVRRMMPGAPDLPTDEAIQTYIRSLNPYT